MHQIHMQIIYVQMLKVWSMYILDMVVLGGKDWQIYHTLNAWDRHRIYYCCGDLVCVRHIHASCRSFGLQDSCMGF